MSGKRRTVLEATEADLAAIRSVAPEVADSGLAASALALAEALDSDTSPAQKSMCGKTYLDTLDRLRELTPPKRERDGIDDLAERRKRRLGRAKTADMPHS